MNVTPNCDKKSKKFTVYPTFKSLYWITISWLCSDSDAFIVRQIVYFAVSNVATVKLVVCLHRQASQLACFALLSTYNHLHKAFVCFCAKWFKCKDIRLHCECTSMGSPADSYLLNHKTQLWSTINRLYLLHKIGFGVNRAPGFYKPELKRTTIYNFWSSFFLYCLVIMTYMW